MSGLLLAAAVGLPLSMLLASAWSRLRIYLPFLFPFAPVPALAAALFAHGGSILALGEGRAALRFSLDLPGAMLLGTAAVLWMCAGVYATQGAQESSDPGGFIVSWLMTLTGCVGVFLAADLIGFYFLLALLSVGASGLVLQGRGPQAVRAAGLYLGIALFAEAILLAGLILLAQAVPGGSLLIRDVAAALPSSPWRDTTLLLLIAGLGIKAGLVPLHFWMPVAYGTAPIPAAAVMSGAAVKASILAMIRFLPFGMALPALGHPLAAIGFIGAFYGVAIGITQSRPQIILAYSSVSQMGFLVALIGTGTAKGDAATALAASFYAVHHLLVKGALFLAVGAVMLSGRKGLPLILVPAAIIALGLGGLPLTGGALAKYATKSLMSEGLPGVAAAASSVATTLLMIHFMQQLRKIGAGDAEARAPAAMSAAWLIMATASLTIPWALYLSAPIGTLSNALAPAALWSALWPVLVGTGLAITFERFSGRLPRVPAGDIGVALIALTEAGIDTAGLLQRADAFLRRWSVSCIALLLVSLVLGWALMATR